jgi:hypothetical protein
MIVAFDTWWVFQNAIVYFCSWDSRLGIQVVVSFILLESKCGPFVRGVQRYSWTRIESVFNHEFRATPECVG